MRNKHSIFVGVTALLLLLCTAGFASEASQISVYASQTTFQVAVGVRDGVDYVGLTDLLDPLGHLEAKATGSKYAVNFNGHTSEFQEGKRQVVAGDGAKLTLSANFVMVDDRGYVPVGSVAQLLPHIVGKSVEFRPASRRLFIGSPQFHFTAKLHGAPSRLVLSFPSPVHPEVKVEKGSVRLLFLREPVVNEGANEVAYHDAFVRGTQFKEIPGGAELIARLGQPAKVSVAQDGRTVTIEPAPEVAGSARPAPSAQAPPAPSATQTTPAAQAAPPSAPPASPSPASTPPASANVPRRGLPFVILDPSHGGRDNGANFSSTLQEKTVTLSLARRLQRELEAHGIPVALTRTADTDMSWDQRAVAANTSHALLYLALHAAANGHGIRFYTALLPEQGAALPSGESPHRFVPWDLVQSAHLEPSLQAAAALANECRKEGLPVQVSMAPVGPLSHITLTAVAVEVAPLGSDPAELASEDYQRKIAKALAKGIAALRGPGGATP
jgi:N-acetylmuramoyl-L-alanine amidase